MRAHSVRALTERGAALLTGVGARPPQAVGRAVDDVLARYADPARGYHDHRHLAEVLDHVDELADQSDHPDRVRLAAWYHDCVHTAATGAGQDEEASARLAVAQLTELGVRGSDVDDVARLVRLTATHDPAQGDRDGAVLCDADLAVLARDRAGYADYVAGVRREYAHVPEPDFRAGRAAVLRALVDRPRLFHTEVGRARWEQAGRANVAAELAHLAREVPS